MRYLLFFVLPLLLFSCEKKEDNFVTPNNTDLVENRTFNKTLVVDGHDYDGLVIRGCTFENIIGDGLIIKNADGVTVRGCTFSTITANGILLPASGGSNSVEISDCELSNIDAHGIFVTASHSRTRIKNNVIHTVGLDPSSTVVPAPHHGVYLLGPAFSVSGNTISGIGNEDANCITVETYGTISANTVFHATKYGIAYVGNQAGELGDLVIQNNMIYDNTERGINLATGSSSANLIGLANIRFNTIVALDEKAPIGIGPDLSAVTIRVSGNLTVRPDGNQAHVLSSSPYSSEFNFTSTEDPGFVDYAGRNLHLNDTSAVRGSASAVQSFPSNDFDGDARTGTELEAGADEL